MILEPFNPLAVAIALDASFVARVFVGFRDHAKDVIKKAILHKGYALVDVFQPCVTFNKVNTYQWFRENTYLLDPSYDPGNRALAFQKAIEDQKLPLGIFYKHEKAVFEEQLPVYKQDRTSVCKRPFNPGPIEELIKRSKD